jgi:hypothetical protein
MKIYPKIVVILLNIEFFPHSEKPKDAKENKNIINSAAELWMV